MNYQLSNISHAAKHVIKQAQGKTLWVFKGDMGAGKTTLIKAICLQLAVIDDVSSPTFSLVNQYKTKDNKTIFHFDFYRIKSIEEVYDIGYEEFFYSNNICLIEWPQMIDELLLDEDVYEVNIIVLEEGLRQLVLSYKNN